MARRKQTSIFFDLARLIAIALMLSYASVIGFWNSIPEEYRLLILILGVITLVCGAISITMFVIYRRRQRKLAWQTAMQAWKKTSQTKKTPEYDAAPGDLEKFAAQVYHKMGYRATRTGQTGDHGVDVRLVNPNNEIELVQCKQWNKPVGEPQIRDLYGAMAHDKAVRGHVWAPGGFSKSAREWARKKPILLIDNEEVGRLVESAYLKK